MRCRQLLSPLSPSRGRETVNAALNLNRRYLRASGTRYLGFGQPPQHQVLYTSLGSELGLPNWASGK